MSRVVLDASAILAFLQAEPGAEVIAAALPDACVSAVNLCEVVAKLVEHGLSDDEAADTIALLPVETVAFDGAAALRSGLLHRQTQRRGISLGDRACLGLAAERGRPALTTDRAWRDLGLAIEVRVPR